MHERQEQSLEQCKSVSTFLARESISPEPPLLIGKRKQLDETIARIDACYTTQVTARMSTVGKLDARRKHLRERRMLPLRSIAKGQLLFAPGAEAALRVPHARASAQVVAAAALRMADALMPHTRLLSAAGVSKDFLREMRHEARGLALTVKQNDAIRRRNADATRTLAQELRKGLDILSVIDGILRLHATRDFLTQYDVMRRRRKKVGRPRKIRHRKPKPEVS
jgi:hypothetical protein